MVNSTSHDWVIIYTYGKTFWKKAFYAIDDSMNRSIGIWIVVDNDVISNLDIANQIFEK